MFKFYFVLLFSILSLNCFSQILYRNLSADDLVVTGTVSRSSEFIVDQNGLGDFTSISQAVAHVDALHLIYPSKEISVRVSPGSYYEDITVTKARLILRGDNRRAKIYGSLTVLETPTYISELYIRSADGRIPLVYKNITSSTLSSLGDCYIINAISSDSTTYAVQVTNSSVWVNMAGCEFYTQNVNAGSNAKSAIFSLQGSGGIEVFACRLKTTSSSPKNDDEIFGVANGSFNVQVENSIWVAVHDETPSLYLNGSSWLAWADSSVYNSQNKHVPIAIRGDSITPVDFFNKTVGDMFINGGINMGNTKNMLINLYSDGTNTFQADVNSITSVVTVSKSSISNTVSSLWVGYAGEYITETNRTGGEVLGTIYFIRKP